MLDYKESRLFWTISGKEADQFKETGLTVFKGSKADIPLIKECQVNFECKLLEEKKR